MYAIITVAFKWKRTEIILHTIDSYERCSMRIILYFMFFSFISVTYIIEAMAAANALMKLERARENRAAVCFN